MSAVAMLPPYRRAVFVSDVHLGSRHCHAAELARFLSTLRCERLYLVGDIIDLWWLAHRRANWQQTHSEVIQALHALRLAGTEIIYIPGNHDASLRQICGLMLPAMQVRRRAIHITADGRRLLVVHGDDYDGITHFGGLQERFGDWVPCPRIVVIRGNDVAPPRQPDLARKRFADLVADAGDFCIEGIERGKVLPLGFGRIKHAQIAVAIGRSQRLQHLLGGNCHV